MTLLITYFHNRYEISCHIGEYSIPYHHNHTWGPGHYTICTFLQQRLCSLPYKGVQYTLPPQPSTGFRTLQAVPFNNRGGFPIIKESRLCPTTPTILYMGSSTVYPTTTTLHWFQDIASSTFPQQRWSSLPYKGVQYNLPTQTIHGF
jgi:hypothetical protein